MHRHCYITMSLLGAAWLAAAGGVSADAKDQGENMCQYGTTVRFEKSPSDAAGKALKEEKLVMVLHVSGDFENPAFT
jgi:hypothetical protein